MMITPNLILDAVQGAMEALWVDAPCYRNAVPKDFIRPSSFVELDKAEVVPGPLRGVAEATVTVKLTVFCPVDDYRHGDQAALSQMAMEAAGPLLQPLVLEAAERALEPPRLHLLQGDDFATWTMVYAWRFSVSELAPAPAPEPPVAEDLSARIQVEAYPLGAGPHHPRPSTH